MEFSMEKAQEISSRMNKAFSTKGLLSRSNISPSTEAAGKYIIEMELHPDEGHLKDIAPSYVSLSAEGGSPGAQYVKRTPRTPSQRNAPFEDRHPSPTQRSVDPSKGYPDVNPAYPGMRRVPELQDLVRRVAMPEKIKNRLEKSIVTLSALSKLHDLALKYESK